MLRDYLRLHFIVLIWGFTGILGALIKIPAIDLVIFRTLFASIAMAGLVFVTPAAQFRQSRATILKLVGTGFLVGFHWLLFFAAVKAGGASIGMIGLSTATLWTALLAPFFQKAKLSWLEMVLGFIVVAALSYIFHVEHTQGLGLVLSVAAGFVAALFSSINGHLTKQNHHFSIAFYEISGACLACIAALPLAPLFSESREQFLVVPEGRDLAYLLILSLACTVYPYAASVELLRRVPVFAANLSVNMEPVYGMVLAAIILGENQLLSERFYWGSSFIVAAVFSYPMMRLLLLRRQKLAAA